MPDIGTSAARLVCLSPDSDRIVDILAGMSRTKSREAEEHTSICQSTSRNKKAGVLPGTFISDQMPLI